MSHEPPARMRPYLQLLFLALVPAAAAPLHAQFDALVFRSIGPAALGGRIHDVEALPGDPSTIYVAAASGGLWKSTNKGTTWAPIFDRAEVSTFGDVAIFPGDPNVVWIGTGEQNNRQSSSWGNGVYRSTDGGRTWTHVGLAETRHIGRVIAHPTDRNTAWVAAAGNLWKPSTERGVFKTTDGGRSWQRVLFVDTLTGATDLVVDPANPDVLVAATYQRLRTPWGFNGGGPGSALWKSTDGGVTWRRLTAGIPAGDKGRIGLAIARTDGRILHALVEHPTEGGNFRSEDGGETWTRVNRLNPRPMYYSKVFIDPTDAQRVWVVGVSVYRSDDGGRSFRTLPTSPTYDVGLKSDHHVLWIDPTDSRHVYLGGDGGLHESWDLGETWLRINNLPIGQFYAVGADDREPYWVYGGMQDNHSHMGPSRTRHWLGIVNEDWRQVGFGDGMYNVPDPANPRWLYSSSQNLNVQRVDIETGDRLDVKPHPALGDSAYRFDWTAPIVPSRHTPGTVYMGGNRLFISRDHGSSWTSTRDLTRAVDRDTLSIMGVPGPRITVARHDGESSFSEATTISESPLDPRVLWVGTDDGNVQLSRDGGSTWTELSSRIAGVPSGTLVARVVASSAGRGTAYVAFDAHRSGDFTPYLFRTTDFGATWRRVTSGLPASSPVRTVHEYPGTPGVVLAGLEHALYLSLDTARTWTKWSANLPTTAYLDILVHPRTRDVILATHGRSIWILDDASPLAQWSPAVAARRAHLFPVRAVTLVQYWQDFSYRAQGAYAADNPPDGALITYHLARPAQAVQVTITSPAGKVVRTLGAPATAGALHRINWDLRHEDPPSAGGGGGEEAGSAASLPLPPRPIHDRGPFVSPGSYTVTLEADGERVSRTVVVKGDPLLPYTTAQHQARERFLLDVLAMQREVAALEPRLGALGATFRQRQNAAPAGTPARDEASARLARLTNLDRRLRAGRGAIRGALGALASAFNGSGAQQGSLAPPTATHRARAAALRRAIDAVRAETEALAR